MLFFCTAPTNPKSSSTYSRAFEILFDLNFVALGFAFIVTGIFYKFKLLRPKIISKIIMYDSNITGSNEINIVDSSIDKFFELINNVINNSSISNKLKNLLSKIVGWLIFVPITVGLSEALWKKIPLRYTESYLFIYASCITVFLFYFFIFFSFMLFSMKKRILIKNAAIKYFLPDKLENAYKEFRKNFIKLANSNKITITDDEIEPNPDVKENLSSSISTNQIQIGYVQPKEFLTDFSIPTILINNKLKLLFFPDKLVYFYKKCEEAIDYNEIIFETFIERIVHDTKIPDDATKLEDRWFRETKSGEPDRRYSENQQFPVYKYERLYIELPNKRIFHIWFSKSGICDDLIFSINELAKAIKETKTAPNKVLKVQAIPNALPQAAGHKVEVQPIPLPEAVANNTLSYSDMDKYIEEETIANNLSEIKASQLSDKIVKKTNESFPEEETEQNESVNPSLKDKLLKLKTLYKEKLINKKQYETQSQQLISSFIHSKEALKEDKNNNKNIEKVSAKKIGIYQQMTVNQFKSIFRKIFGTGIRIYSGNSFADNDEFLQQIGFSHNVNVNLNLPLDLKIGMIEKAFKNKIGIKIQIENKNGALADNNLTLAEIINSKT